jgi:hypothetical protein
MAPAGGVGVLGLLVGSNVGNYALRCWTSRATSVRGQQELRDRYRAHCVPMDQRVSLLFVGTNGVSMFAYLAGMLWQRRHFLAVADTLSTTFLGGIV